MLRVLSGIDEPNNGIVQRKKGMSIATVSQELPSSVNPDDFVLRAVLNLAITNTSSPLVRAALAYADALYAVEGEGATDDVALARLTSATVSMDRNVDAWQVDAYMRTALTKLQLPLDRRVCELSGGQRKRLGLAAALVAKPDIILADEPTNALSIEGIQFLEETLAEPARTSLVISHDRWFVDSFASHIWELDGSLHEYGPGYAAFLDSKAKREEKDHRERLNLVRTYKKELAWMRKQPKARGTKSKSRVENFEAIQERVLSKKKVLQVKDLQAASTRLGAKVLELHDITLRRGDKLILRNFSYEFEPGERVGICGGNGVGKSSLLRAIMGQLPLESGSIEIGETVVFGYFDQEGSDLPGQKRVMEYVSELSSLAGGPGVTSRNVSTGPRVSHGDAFEAQLDATLENLSHSVVLPSAQRNENTNPLARLNPVALLDHFGFDRSQQHSFISMLSGGERRRLQLLSLLLRNPNCMLLDEPGNDIDIRTLSLLEDTLDDYKGTLIMVSHDRFMMDRLVDRMLVVEGNGITSYVEGRFTDYLAEKKASELAMKRAQRAGVSLQSFPAPSSVVADAPVKPKKLSYREKNELQRLEREVEELEAKHRELNSRLENEAASARYSELAEWSEELGHLERDINAKSERWMELSERA